MIEDSRFDDADILEEVVGRAASPIPKGTSRFCAFEGVELAVAPPEPVAPPDRTQPQITDEEMARRKQEVGGRPVADIFRDLEKRA